MSSERSVKDLSGLYNSSNGGADGIRTHDLLDAIEARSQLRHGPTGRAPVYHTHCCLNRGDSSSAAGCDTRDATRGRLYKSYP